MNTSNISSKREHLRQPTDLVLSSNLSVHDSLLFCFLFFLQFFVSLYSFSMLFEFLSIFFPSVQSFSLLLPTNAMRLMIFSRKFVACVLFNFGFGVYYFFLLPTYSPLLLYSFGFQLPSHTFIYLVLGPITTLKDLLILMCMCL